MVVKVRCHLCEVDISKTNWSKHIKTQKHLFRVSSLCSDTFADTSYVTENRENIETYEIETKFCSFCNETISKDWIAHLKSIKHKKNKKLFTDEIKAKHKKLSTVLLEREKENLKILTSKPKIMLL
jgi:DNA-directed RNA polymerase subunit N (RpoN/RPB10)